MVLVTSRASQWYWLHPWRVSGIGYIQGESVVVVTCRASQKYWLYPGRVSGIGYNQGESVVLDISKASQWISYIQGEFKKKRDVRERRGDTDIDTD